MYVCTKVERMDSHICTCVCDYRVHVRRNVCIPAGTDLPRNWVSLHPKGHVLNRIKCTCFQVSLNHDRAALHLFVHLPHPAPLTCLTICVGIFM